MPVIDTKSRSSRLKFHYKETDLLEFKNSSKTACRALMNSQPILFPFTRPDVAYNLKNQQKGFQKNYIRRTN